MQTMSMVMVLKVKNVYFIKGQEHDQVFLLLLKRNFKFHCYILKITMKMFITNHYQ